MDLSAESEPEDIMPKREEARTADSSGASEEPCRNPRRKELEGLKNSAIARMARESGLNDDVDHIMDHNGDDMHDALINLVVDHETKVKEVELQKEQSRWREAPKRKADARTGSAQGRKNYSREKTLDENGEQRFATKRRVTSRETHTRR